MRLTILQAIQRAAVRADRRIWQWPQSDRSLSSSSCNVDHTSLQTYMLVMLEQKKRLLAAISDEIYMFHCPIHRTTIGNLLEKSLESLQQPLARFKFSKQDGFTQYDIREKKSQIQTSRFAAEVAILDLQERLLALAKNLHKSPEDNMNVTIVFDGDSEKGKNASQLALEISNAIHRCVRHNAAIKKILEQHYPTSLSRLPMEFGANSMHAPLQASEETEF